MNIFSRGAGPGKDLLSPLKHNNLAFSAEAETCHFTPEILLIIVIIMEDIQV